MKSQQPIQNYYLVKIMPYKLLTKVNKDQEMFSIYERYMTVKHELGFCWFAFCILKWNLAHFCTKLPPLIPAYVKVQYMTKKSFQPLGVWMNSLE